MKNTFEKSKEIFSEALNCLAQEDFVNAEKKLLESYNLTPDRISIASNLVQIYIKLEDSIKLNNFLKKINNFEDTFDFKIGLGFLKFFNKNYTDSLNICKDLKPNNLKQQVQSINLKIKCTIASRISICVIFKCTILNLIVLMNNFLLKCREEEIIQYKNWKVKE